MDPKCVSRSFSRLLQVQLAAGLHSENSLFISFWKFYSNNCLTNMCRYVSFQSEEQQTPLGSSSSGPSLSCFMYSRRKGIFPPKKLLLSVKKSLNFKEMAAVKVLARYCKETNIPDILIFPDVSSVTGEGSTGIISYAFYRLHGLSV